VGVPGVYGDELSVLSQIVDRCAAADADLAAAGDIFDGPSPAPEVVRDLYDVLDRLVSSGRKLYYVIGNHDRGRDWLVPFGAGAVRLDGGVFEFSAGTVSGSSYVPYDRFAEAVAGVPDSTVGVYHQSWSDLNNYGKTPVSAVPGHRCVVGGDIHVRRTIPLSGPGRTFVSTGPLAPQAVDQFCHVTSAVDAVGADGVPFLLPDVVTRRTYCRVRLADGAVAVTCSVPSIVPPGSGGDQVESALEVVRSVVAAARPGLPDHLSRPFVAVDVVDRVAPSVEGALRAAAGADAVLYVRNVSGGRYRKRTVPVSAPRIIESVLASATISPAAKVVTADVLSADTAADVKDVLRRSGGVS
jgi:hypothetical protein